MDQFDLELIKPYIILLVPLLWGILEGVKRAGVPAKWIPFVNAALSLLAGGGLALLERQDLVPAVSQIVMLFLGAAGVHDRLQKPLKRAGKKPNVEKGLHGMVYPNRGSVWTSASGGGANDAIVTDEAKTPRL